MPHRRSRPLATMLLAGTIASCLPAHAQPGSTPAVPTPPAKSTPLPPAAAPIVEPKVTAPGEFKDASELLDALENADEKIRTITADLSFTTVAGEIEGNDKQIRRGKVWFRNRSEPVEPAASQPAAPKPAAKPETVTPSTNAAACVYFEYLILPASNNKRVAENKTYIVDGPVMIEKIEGEKLVNRIRFAPGEKQQDPLKLGEGPFPLPFGQKREEVLARFNARLVPALETVVVESLKQRLAECYQLVLTPKPNAGISSKVKEVRVWYQKKDLLPTQAIIVRPDGGSDEFFLIGMQVNKPLPPNVFDTSVPAGWRVEEKERP
jgi:hypothetical protein